MRIAILLLALAACSENDDIPSPRVSDVAPASATPGAVVTVSGDYFCQQPETGNEDPLDCSNIDGVVWFGSVPGATTLYTDTSVTVEVPNVSAGSVQLYVSASGRSSNTIAFVVN